MEKRNWERIVSLCLIIILVASLITLAIAMIFPYSRCAELRSQSWFLTIDTIVMAAIILYFLFEDQLWNKAKRKSLDELAKAGDADAQYKLSKQYYNSADEQEQKKYLYWLQEACQQNHPDAMASMGYAYLTGNGVETSARKAEEWFRKAAEGGAPYGHYYYSQSLQNTKLHHNPDYEEAFKWMQKAVEQEYPPEAFAELAAFYRQGKGVERDFLQAERYYRKGLHTRGWKFALANYAIMAEEVAALPEDSTERQAWMKRHSKLYLKLLVNIAESLCGK